MRTYLIESQALFVPYLVRMMHRAGCEVVATSHIVDCADIVANTPAAVLVDVDYFQRNGPTELCRIRSAVETAKLIVLSEIDDALFTATCVLSGASLVCSKTDGEEKIVRALRSTFANAR